MYRPRMIPSGAPSAAYVHAEELADHFIHRPLARPIVGMLLPTAISANQVTVAGGLLGALAGASLALGVVRPSLRLASAALLLASTVFDCVDGQLARARGTMSSHGMALDAAADVVVGLATIVAATYFAAAVFESPRLWLMAPAALASYAAQAFCFDVVKERYLVANRIEYASSKALEATRSGRDERQPHWVLQLWWRIVEPVMRRSRHAAPSRSQMRAWTFIGPGTHMCCLYLAAAASYWRPIAVVVCLVIFTGVMNVLLAVLFAAAVAGVKV